MIAALFIKIKMQSLETGEHSNYNIFKIDAKQWEFSWIQFSKFTLLENY